MEITNTFIKDSFNAYVRAVMSGTATHTQTIERTPRQSMDKFHCSSCGKCPRAIVLQRAGVETLKDLDLSLRNFANGITVENWVRDGIKHALNTKGCAFQGKFNQRVQSKDGEVVGEYDVILQDTRRHLYDIKSCHEDKLDWGFDETYRKQLGSYAMCEEDAGRVVDTGGIAYCTKSTWRVVMDYFDLGSYTKQAREFWDVMRGHWDKFENGGDLPPEIPMKLERSMYPKRRNFKTSGGNGMMPEWTCNPRWCRVAQHCPDIWAYWSSRPWDIEEA